MQTDTATLESTLQPRTNWSGNYIYSTHDLVEPRSVAELQQAVLSAHSVRALGSRHSFNSIADTSGRQISLRHLNSMELDAQARTVTIGSGVTYGDLAPWLNARGFALHNLASLPHITIAGAVATGTHGSGPTNGSLATAVRAVEFVDGTAELVQLSRAKDGNRFAGAVVALGALGIVTRLTLEVQPRFNMRQVVYLDLPFATVERHAGEIFSAGYSVSLFTDWQNSRATQVWIKSRVDPAEPFAIAPEFFGARAAARRMHPLLDHPAEHSTEQMGIPGPWHERLPHFRMDFTPSSGQEIQAEYFVPRAQGMAAVRAVETLREVMAPHLLVSELRTIAADDLWLSPCYQQDTMALHFTWKPDSDALKQILPQIEARLEPFAVRPHWGKVFTMDPAIVQSRYSRLTDFRALATEYDPVAKFRNSFLQHTLFAD